MDHPHIHCIVTGGGLSLNNKKWISSKRNFFLPVKVISSLFRGKFMHYLKQKYYNDKLIFPRKIQSLKELSIVLIISNTILKPKSRANNHCPGLFLLKYTILPVGSSKNFNPLLILQIL
jgi:hypothetical protein